MIVLNFGSLNLDYAYQVENFVQPVETLSAMSQTVKFGGKGSVAFTEKEMVRQAAFPVKAVDTTAAGDTFTGYFIAGLMEGRSLQDCMRLSSMASAIGVTRSGAATSIPEREEVEKALEGRI